jgi:hypothetical protein
VKQHAEDALMNVTVLTQAQRMVDCFTLQSFHLSVTMAGISSTIYMIVKQMKKSFVNCASPGSAIVGALQQWSLVPKMKEPS